jgi:hypothetical protein
VPGVVPPVHVSLTPSEVARGGTLTATWGGIPAPTAGDQLRLYPLGSLGADFDEVASSPTDGAAAGRRSLTLPGELATGWYALRLLGPDPGFWNLLVVIARSEPILVTATPTIPPIAPCEVEGASACDDGDPCTVDGCVPGQGCTSTPAADLAALTCTCQREQPVACAGQRIPASVGRRQARACSLFDEAAATTRATRVPRRLEKAVRTINGSMHLVSRVRKSRDLSHDCAAALTSALRDTKDRAQRLLETL